MEQFMPDKRLALVVMDHRTKFQGSWALQLWWERHGVQRPEDVYPDLAEHDAGVEIPPAFRRDSRSMR